MASDEQDLDIRMHPLVVMSMADHSTRNQFASSVVNPNNNSNAPKNKDTEANKVRSAFGVVLGTQSSRVISILETFEVSVNHDAADNEQDRDQILNIDDFESDLKLFRDAYKEFELLGWYAVCDEIQPIHHALHRIMQAYNERPIFVHMSITTTRKQEDLPMNIYTSAVQVRSARDEAEFFVEVPFKVVSDESERVTMVHCARTISMDLSEAKSSLERPYRTLCDAAEKLQERIALMRDYLVQVQNGEIKGDQALLRQIKAVCNRVPLMQGNAAFSKEAISSFNDAVLVAYLSFLTQTSALASSIDARTSLLRGPPRGGGFLEDEDMMMGMRGGSGRYRMGGRRRKGGMMNFPLM